MLAAVRCTELIAVLPHDRRGRFQPNADATSVIDEGALGGNSFDNVLRGQYRRHPATLTRPPGLCRVIPEIDIWRAASLMLKRYGEKAEAECVTRTDELAAAGDHDGVAVWRRITDAVAQLANKAPRGLVH